MNMHVLARTSAAELDEFSRLYRAHFGFVRGVLARLGVATAALDDAAQDVFLVVHCRRASFDDTRALAPWLIGIARKIAFRYRRASARGLRARVALMWTQPATVSSPVAGRIEAREFLEKFLAQLGDDRRRAFILGELYGLTGPEIAAHLDIPVDTAYTRLRACRALLEQALLAAVADDPPEPAAARRSWQILVPQLSVVRSPTGAGWLAGVVARAQAAAASVLVAAAAVLVVSGPSLPAAAPRPISVTSQAPAGDRPHVDPMPASPPPVSLPPPPAHSRLQARLASAPRPQSPADRHATPTTPQPGDPLGAAVMTAAVEALRRGDPTLALAHLDHHAHDYPTSALEQTRTLTRVRARCQLGRDREARDAALPLRRHDPALVRDALAGSCVDGA